MAQIEIKPLASFDGGLFRRLDHGYTSPAKYVVSKTETPEQTVIRLDRIVLEQPYVKVWDHDPDTFAMYAFMVKQGHSLAAYDVDQVVGVAIAESRAWNRTLWVWEIVVADSHRRQGIGRRLLDRMENMARANNCRVIALEVQNTNAPAIDFYYAAGFVIEAVDLSYYTNDDLNSEVAIFMKRKVA